MRITDIRETAVALKSSLRNAVFDFSEMTTSVVAVITDAVREGRPVIGYAFNSTGRYACGAQMRARFIPRILTASPDSLLNAAKDNLEPEKILACMMQRENPWSHRAFYCHRHDRGRGMGRGRQNCRQAALPRAGGTLQRGRAPEKVPCYVGGGWYPAGKGHSRIAERDPRAAGAGLPCDEDQGGRRDDTGRREARGGGAESRSGQPEPRGGRERRFRPQPRAGLRGGARAVQAALVRGAHRSLAYELLAEVTANYEAPIGSGENLFSTQDVENLVRFGGLRSDRDILQIDVPQSYGIVQFSRTLAMLEGRGWRRSAIFPHGGNQMTLHIVGGFGLDGCEAYPGVFGVFAGFADDARMEDGYLELPDRPGIGFEAQNGLCEVMRELAA